MGSNEDAGRVCTVLVTGFGPFQDRYPVNPSYEIAKSLPAYLPATDAHSSGVRILNYGTPIRVGYKDVRELVPMLHKTYAGTADIVLHIGMASGRKYYAIERFAHRNGYDKDKDVDGLILPAHDGKKRFGDCPAVMVTSLNYDDVLHNWRLNVMAAASGAQPQQTARPAVLAVEVPDLRSSEDAGHYLCDYIYFNSLAWFGRRNRLFEGGRSSDRPVLFLHVPAESDAEALETGRSVVIGLIRAMADSWAADEKGGAVPG